MNPASKLYETKLSYAALMNEYKRFNDKQLHEIFQKKSSFCDWLVDSTCNGLSSSETKEFTLSIKHVIKEKLEILITAIGPIKLNEIPSRLLRSEDFASVNFLREIFTSGKGFVLVNKNGDDYVQISPPGSSNDPSPSKMNYTTFNSNCNSNLIDITPSHIENYTSHCEATEPTKTPNTKVKDAAKEMADDTKARQLRFLFQCQPDVIAALHPTVTLNGLFKAYSFWKSYCMHSATSFIAWMFNMYKFKSKNCVNAASSIITYTFSVKKLLAQEAFYYVTNTPRTVDELTTLVSKTKVGFVDKELMLDAIKENSDILRIDSSSIKPFSSHLVYSVNNWNILNPTQIQQITPTQQIAASSQSTSCLSSNSSLNDDTKSIFSGRKQDEVEHIHLKVIDSTFDLHCYLKDLYITDEVMAKIIPLLTVKVSWESIRCTILKLIKDHKDFVLEMAEQFDSFVDFLIYFAKKFKPSLHLKNFEEHLMILACNTIDTVVAAEQPLSIDDLVQKFQQENVINLVSRNFLLNMYKVNSKKITVETDMISQTKTIKDVSKRSGSDPEKTSDDKIIEEFKDLPKLSEMLSSSFRCIEFCNAFQNIPKHLKIYCKKFSGTFYSFVINTLNCKLYNDNLRMMVCTEIKQMFEDLQLTSMKVKDLPEKLLLDDDFLIDSADIKDAVINCKTSSFLEVKGDSICLLKPNDLSSKCCVNSKTIKNHDPSVEELSVQINAILNGSNLAKEKLGMIFHCLKHMPESVCNYLKNVDLSAFRFIMKTVPSEDKFTVILKGELLKYIQDATLFCDEYLKGFFRYFPQFITTDEFVEFLMLCKESFAVVGHYEVGNLVSSVRFDTKSGQVLFFNRKEEETLYAVKRMLSNKKDTSCGELFDLLWNCKKFTVEQRDFIFGVQDNFWPLKFYKLHLRRYFLMYPSVFTVNKQSVSFKFYQEQELELPEENNVAIVLSSSSNEDGEVFSSDEPSKKSRKRTKIKRKQTTSDSSSPSVKAKRKHKRKRRKHKDCVVSPQKISDIELLNEQIASLPDYLIQDVIAGRLMASDGQVMKLTDLLALLAVSLLREKKELILGHETTSNFFKDKVMAVLKQGVQFQLITDNENQDDDTSSRVCLITHPSSLSKPAESQPLIVFKWIHRVTGVSKKKISNYVKKVLDVNKKSLTLSIIFSMISQRYGAKKTVSETPNDILHSQTVACLKSDSKFFINIVKKTCSLSDWITVNETKEGLQEILKNVSDKDIVQFLSSYLQTTSPNCFSIDELVGQFASKFKEELHSLTIGSIRIIVQGFVAADSKFGFTPHGKIVYQSNETQPNVSDETSDESSDDCLKMDISDDENAIPDSTNIELVEMEDRTSDEENDEKNRNKYSENDVIRCTYEKNVADEVVAADSTTSDAPQTTSPLKDPRIKGKAYRNKVRSEKPAERPEDVSADSKIKTTVLSAESTPDQLISCERRLNQHERQLVIESYAKDFFKDNGYYCQTEVFVNSAYQHFKNERFARSMLAFESYIRNFVVTSVENEFIFGNPSGDVGASFIFYKPKQTGIHSSVKPNLPFDKHLPKVLDIVYTSVNSQADKQANLLSVCKKVEDFLSKVVTLDQNEMPHVSRNLVLLVCIRNLKWFFFAKVEPIIYIRQERVESPSCTVTAEDSKPNVIDIKHNFINPVKPNSHIKVVSTIMALQKMAEILRNHGPCKKSDLRDLWLINSDANHRKVFGTGVSFSLSLRKFEKYFPCKNDGRIHVDETAFAKFLVENA